MTNFKVLRIKDRELLDSYHRMRCIICSRYGCDPCHIKSKGTGGDDTHDNLLPMCRVHHHEQTHYGHQHMADKYSIYILALESRGWTLINKKLRRK